MQPIKKIEGVVKLPGSKSLSNRALLLAALAEGTTLVKNLLVRGGGGGAQGQNSAHTALGAVALSCCMRAREPGCTPFHAPAENHVACRMRGCRRCSVPGQPYRR